MLQSAFVERANAALAWRVRAGLSQVRARLPKRPAPAILMYHRIAEDRFDPWGTIVSPDRFADQLSWLAEQRTVLPLPEFADRHRRGELPEDAVAITFDDGYACNADVAAPLLERLGLPATIFLPVEWIEKGEPYWWDEIRTIVFDSDRSVLRLAGRQIELREKQPSDLEWTYGAPPRTARQQAFRQVWLDLILKKPAQIDEAMGELRAQYGGDKAIAGAAPMSRAQVRRAAASGIEFGSHALRHPPLTSIGPAEQADEIVGSVARCEALTGSRPNSFAYPFGILDSESERLVEEAGFTCACSVETGAVRRESRTFALPRMQVGNWRSGRLKRALNLL